MSARVNSESASAGANALLGALTHPAVVRLARLLKTDLSNKEQRNAIISLAERNLKALAAHNNDPAEAEAARPITAYYVRKSLNTYRRIIHLSAKE